MEAGDMSQIGIVGAGTMGSRIAFRCAIPGKDVNLFDISSQVLEKAMKLNQKWLEERVNDCRLTAEQAQDVFCRLHPCDSLGECLAGVELVTETVPENLELKRQVFADFEEIDRAWMLESRTPSGPFGMMDRVGLDVVRDIEMQYYQESGDESDKPPRLLEDLIAQGRLGMKSGRGFYTYPNPAYEQPGWLQKEPPWIKIPREGNE